MKNSSYLGNNTEKCVAIHVVAESRHMFHTYTYTCSAPGSAPVLSQALMQKLHEGFLTNENLNSVTDASKREA